MIQRQIESMGQMRELLLEGAELTGQTARGQWLQDAIEVFNWLQRAIADTPMPTHRGRDRLDGR